MVVGGNCTKYTEDLHAIILVTPYMCRKGKDPPSLLGVLKPLLKAQGTDGLIVI